MLRTILLGVGAGLLAGPVVGLAEALHILTSGSPSEYGALFYATVLYGVIGVFMGLGAGVALAVLSLLLRRLGEAQVFSYAFLLVLCALGAVITRYVVNKVVYLERGVPMQASVVILLIFGAVFLVGTWIGPILLTRSPFKILLRARGTLALYGTILLLAGVFSMSPTRAGSSDGELSPEREQSADLMESPNTIFLVLDTLRWDYLGSYGYPDDISPNLDALAEESVLFEQVVAQSSWTRPSIASFFTSLPPTAHTCDVKVAVLPDELETLAEVLQGHGVITGGLPNNINVTRSFNFQQGFDWYKYMAPDYILGATASASQLSMYNVLRKLRLQIVGSEKRVEDFYQPAQAVLDEALQFVEANKDKRWFLFVHLMEPHDPYFEYPLNGEGIGRAEFEHPDPALADHLKELYAGEVTYMDGRIGEFLDSLRELGLYDDTMIVVTSDHGEEFYEHGGWWHGTTLYEEQVRLPLFVKLPGDGPSLRIPWQVRQIDIPASIVEAMGAGVPETWQGHCLFDEHYEQHREGAAARLAAQAAEEDGMGTAVSAMSASLEEDEAQEQPWHLHPGGRPALSEENFEGNVLSAIRQDGWKIIRANEGNPRGLPELELFDIAEDPLELSNRVGEGLDMQGIMDRLLLQALEQAASGGVERESIDLDAATEERLRMLGYM